MAKRHGSQPDHSPRHLPFNPDDRHFLHLHHMADDCGTGATSCRKQSAGLPTRRHTSRTRRDLHHTTVAMIAGVLLVSASSRLSRRSTITLPAIPTSTGGTVFFPMRSEAHRYTSKPAHWVLSCRPSGRFVVLAVLRLAWPRTDPPHVHLDQQDWHSRGDRNDGNYLSVRHRVLCPCRWGIAFDNACFLPGFLA